MLYRPDKVAKRVFLVIGNLRCRPTPPPPSSNPSLFAKLRPPKTTRTLKVAVLTFYLIVVY